MSEAAREMTLHEWVDTLPVNHSARRELESIERELTEAKARIAASVATCDALLEPRNTSISRAVSTAAKEIKRLLQPKGPA